MSPIQIFTLLQTLIIFIGTIITFLSTRHNNRNERKYILPYCLCNMLAMFILTPYEFIEIPLKVIEITMYIFACCETIILPNYLASIIKKKKGNTFQIIICTSALFISQFVANNYTSLIYLVSNIYISYYVYCYFIWLFNGNEDVDLKKSTHYWVVMGICVCYCGSVPYWFAELIILNQSGFLLYNQIAKLIFIMYIILNISMYLLFIKAFICQIKRQKYFSGQF